MMTYTRFEPADLSSPRVATSRAASLLTRLTLGTLAFGSGLTGDIISVAEKAGIHPTNTTAILVAVGGVAAAVGAQVAADAGLKIYKSMTGPV